MTLSQLQCIIVPISWVFLSIMRYLILVVQNAVYRIRSEQFCIWNLYFFFVKFRFYVLWVNTRWPMFSEIIPRFVCVTHIKKAFLLLQPLVYRLIQFLISNIGYQFFYIGLSDIGKKSTLNYKLSWLRLINLFLKSWVCREEEGASNDGRYWLLYIMRLYNCNMVMVWNEIGIVLTSTRVKIKKNESSLLFFFGIRLLLILDKTS